MRTLFSRKARRGFSLLELMVSISILLVVMVVLLQVTGAVGEIWKTSTGKISAFQNSRSAFASISRALSQATLNTYNDYVNSAGKFRVNLSPTDLLNFVPDKFARASELHFVSGRTTEVVASWASSPDVYPGHAVFFQAPLGHSDVNNLSSLNRTLNSIGFYVEYAQTDNSILPGWLVPMLGSRYRFRLVQVVQPAEKFSIYQSTSALNYDLDWLDDPVDPADSLLGDDIRPRVLAEDVCLLVIRPRLAPQDEKNIVGTQPGQLNVSYDPVADPTVVGSILAPNYHYDSRAWETGYVSTRVASAPQFNTRKEITRNQTPPIIDVALVGLDRRSLNRFEFKDPTPPTEFTVPAGLFTDASKYEEDLQAYSQKLSNARIKHRIFRTSVELQGAKWSNSN
jgi:uncharacterized protein (TIGR02599 family)